MESIMNTNECTICLLNIESSNIETLPCNHTYHKSCMDLWKNYNNTCPYCRYILNQNMIPTVLFDELIAPDGNIDALNEHNYYKFYRINENIFQRQYVLNNIIRIKNAKIFKNELKLGSTYRITSNTTSSTHINQDFTGTLIKINQICYDGHFSCHININDNHTNRTMIYFSSMHKIELVE